MQEEPLSALAPSRMMKLARLELSGISRKQIASIMGISESRISQILVTEEYKEEEGKIVSENVRQADLLDKGWDSIEAMSVKNVIQELQTNCDPEFSLKAATFANKAIRRKAVNSPNAIVQNAGMRAVIELNLNFATKLSSGEHQVEKKKENLFLDSKKDSDFLPASKVQNLLSVGVEVAAPSVSSSLDKTQSKTLNTIKHLESSGFSSSNL